jgi:hypothetical protein
MDLINFHKFGIIKSPDINQNISNLFRKINIKNIQNNIIMDYEKEQSNKNLNTNYINRNKKPTDININGANINYLRISKLSKSNNGYYNKDLSHQYTICDYGLLSPDTFNNRNKNILNNLELINYGKNYNQKTFVHREKKLPIIIVSNKRPKKKHNFQNGNIVNKKRNGIIKIQSAWRGYFLRKIAIGSIEKYIGFLALIKYMQKMYIKNMKFLFLFKLKKIVKDFIYIKNSSIINVNNNNNKNFVFNKIKQDKLKNINKSAKPNSPKNKVYFRKKMTEKGGCDLKNENKYNSNEIKQSVYIPKKISIYKFEKNKCLFKNNMNNRIKIKNFIDNINKRCYYQNYPIFLYRLKILQKTNLFHNKLLKLKNVIDLMNKKYIKKIFKKYRDHVLFQKIKEDIYKNKDNKEVDKKSDEKGNINNSIFKQLINKKIEKENQHYNTSIKKYFKLWFDQNNNNNNNISVFKNNNYSSTTEKKVKKKHLKIKYSHEISFKTESSFFSDKKDKSKSSTINASHKKIMKVKRKIIKTNNNLRNFFNSNLKLAPKMIKMGKLINKFDNKNILSKYFISWKKVK